MSDQSQTTANTPSEPVLCKLGCGFFGNSATGGCCSKCWRDAQKKNEVEKVASDVKKPQSNDVSIDDPMMEDKLPIPSPSENGESNKKPDSVSQPTRKAAKKKKSYKNLMAGMMTTKPAREEDKEKDPLHNVTGGGAFSKIDKI